MRAATQWDHVSLIKRYQSRLALESPLLRLCAGGLITVKTDAANEVQLRLCANQATLQRRDAHRFVLAGRKADRVLLDHSRISQTDITTGEIQGTTRARKFSDLAKHMIREAGGELDRVYDKDIWFLTATLPGSTVRAIETFAKFDKEIKNALLQNFRKLFAKVCNPQTDSLDYLCVSELQERGAIHFHIAIGWCNERFKNVIESRFRDWWHQILLRYERISGVDMCERDNGGSWRECPDVFQVECQQVEKSVGAYLAKYLSKDASKLGAGQINSPSRWWSISVPLREKLMKARQSETTSFTTYEDAQAQIMEAAKVLVAAGFDVRESRSKWCNQFLGFVVFPKPQTRKHIYEWSKLLCTTRGDKYWDESISVYGFDELWKEVE